MADARVLIVGGGITGVSVARDVAMRGADVMVAERDRFCRGTTGHSHGVLHSGARYLPEDRSGAVACLEENRIYRDIASGCLADVGGLFLRHSADDPAYCRRKQRACAEIGMSVQPLDGRTARKREPALSEAIDEAFTVPDAVISPSRLVAATAAAARERGASLEANAPVTALHLVNDTVTGATVGDRRIAIDHVVNAAGPWAGRIAGMADCALALAPTRGTMVVVDQLDSPVRAVCNRCRPPADGDIVVPRAGGLVLGTTSVPVSDPDDTSVDRSEVSTVVDACTEMLPAVSSAEQRLVFWGNRPLVGMKNSDGRGISRDFVLINHSVRDDVDGLTTITGGKLTTARRMAAAVGEHLSDRLGLHGTAPTANRELPAQDDPSALDRLVAEFAGAAPADAVPLT